MGPSGAGKTSLLNVMAGYITKGINGKMLINGQKANQMGQLQQLSAYIMQVSTVNRRNKAPFFENR